MSEKKSDSSKERRRLGGWLPTQEDAMAGFRRELMDRARARSATTPPASVVREFGDFIKRDAVLRMHMCRAIDEAREAGFELGYRSIDDLLMVIDYAITYAPPFNAASSVILPLNGLLEWPMVMPSGYAVFRDAAFNRYLKRVLDHWCAFLSGPHSRQHLTEQAPDGWFCEKARAKTGMSDFLCDPGAPYWGYTSWNDFFTRRLKPGARPVHDADDPRAIVNACEAAPYAIEHGVQVHDDFWIKSQPYSLQDIFTGREEALADRYAGGTVYQAYLGAHNYHRWHAPVDGRIKTVYRVDGTYYSDIEAEGEDPSSLNDSQGYTTAVAARAIVVIEAAHRPLGQVACVFVGMAEVSSCVVDVVVGQEVRKGDELGYFQFGGSTYCLIFEPGAVTDFAVQPPFGSDRPPLPVNARLATARAG